MYVYHKEIAMKHQTNMPVVSGSNKQGTVINLMKAAQLVVVFGMGLILMSCGDGSNGSVSAQQVTGTPFVAATVLPSPPSRP